MSQGRVRRTFAKEFKIEAVQLSQQPGMSVTKAATVLGYTGAGDELCEGQASVKLPRYGSRPEINAPFLPAKKVKQLLRVLSGLAHIDLTNLPYEISIVVIAYMLGRDLRNLFHVDQVREFLPTSLIVLFRFFADLLLTTSDEIEVCDLLQGQG